MSSMSSTSRINKRLSFVSQTTAQTSTASTIGPGCLGNLTDAQEVKLRALWAIGLKFIEIYEADETTARACTLEDKYVPPAKKTSGSPGKDATRHRYPTLVKEMLSLLPTDGEPIEKMAQRVVLALDNWTPHMYRLIVTNVVKHEHPDALALRFLRACDWDLIKATTMMGKTIYWRTMEAAVDDDIMRHGEGGAAEDELNGQGLTRSLGRDFMKQVRCGKGFIHGTDRAGRPITYIRARFHKSGDQSSQSLERYIIYLLELGRLSLREPVEMATMLLDLSGFRPRNMAVKPLFFLFKTLRDYYPESIGLLIIHNAPVGLQSLWRLIRVFFPSGFAKKLRFTYGKRGLRRYIEPKQMIKELGGDEDWEYAYEEPSPEENVKMNNIATRNCLMEERRALALKFEELTMEWVMNAQKSDKAAEISAKRDQVVEELAENYWELDPYIRARSLYDRQGHFCGVKGVQWYNRDDEDSLLAKLEKRVSEAAVSYTENASSGYESSVYEE